MTLLTRVLKFASPRALPAGAVPSKGCNQGLSSHELPSPVIRREGIHWKDGAGGRLLLLDLEFENPGILPTLPITASVEVAPFGVFLPWKPLTSLAVSSLPPRSRRRVTLPVEPGNAPDQPPSQGYKIQSLPRFPGWTSLLNSTFRAGQAPGSAERIQPFQCPHFVGNLNVFVTRRAPVERHLERAIGLRPGRENFALFVVGDGKRDRYTFSVECEEAGWALELPGIAWDRPVEITSGAVALRIRPPSRAESGKISILVQRESTRQRVPVEFELEAGVSGSKCYFF
jgi:hypothetical protein